MCNKINIKERTVSTMNELLKLIDDYSNKNIYFRGEIKNFNETACLPQICRNNTYHNIDTVGGRDNNWFTKKLEYLGIGTPCRPCKSDSDDDIYMKPLLNISPHCWSLWEEDKYKALLTHYATDFDNLGDLLLTDVELFGAPFVSSFLDITSDITVALHFACSKHKFYLNNGDKPTNSKIIGDGYIFAFDLCGIEKSEYLKLVSFPSYTYFYRNGNEYHFQPFDRITHQRGSFLAPMAYKNDKDFIIECCTLEKEIKKYISEKITLKVEVKEELYKIFGGEKGFDSYFPKIPLSSPKNIDIAKAYENMERITILE